MIADAGPWPDPDHYPVLDLGERDRRWELLRNLMDEQGLVGLVAFGFGRDQWDRYLTGESHRSVAYLPRAGEASAIVGRPTLDRVDSSGAAHLRWVEDVRLAPPIDGLVSLLREHSVGRARVGVVGLSGRSPGESDGVVPFGSWRRVLESFGDTAFIDVTPWVESLALPKSAAEQQVLRKAAWIGEQACLAFVEWAAEGAFESRAVGAAIGTVLALGGQIGFPYFLERSGGPGAFGWGVPEWYSQGVAPRRLARGDSISAELFAFYGGMETQQQIQVSIGPISGPIRELEAACRASYDVALTSIRPGLAFSDLCRLMDEPLRAAGHWSSGPLVQSVSPVLYDGPVFTRAAADPWVARSSVAVPDVPRRGDFELVSGVALSVQPSAVAGGRRVSLGGTVLVTGDGIVALNEAPTRIHVRS